MDGKHPGFQSEGRVWPYRLAILLLPAMVLWHQDNSLFPPPGQIDTWLYFGYFRNLVNFKRDLFPNLYCGSRLTWILPGWAVHSVLAPVAASAVLHLAVLWVAALSLFQTLRRTAGPRTAFLTTLVFSANPQVWYAVGWDYFDGIGIAYCLLTMALLTGAAAQGRSAWRLALAGAGIAGLIYSNLLWTVFVPALLLYYVGLAWMWHRRRMRDLAADVVLWCGAGFLAVTLVLCAVNCALDGSIWFYSPSLHIANVLARKRDWKMNVWTSHGLIAWLWLTLVAAVIALGRMVSGFRKPIPRERAAPILYSAQFLMMLAIYCYLQPQQFGVFAMPFYADLLMPFAFLVIGTSFWHAAETMSGRSYAAVCLLAVLLCGIVWYDYAGDWTPIWPAAIKPVAFIGGAMLAAALLLRRRAIGIVCAIAGLALFSSELRFIPKKQLFIDERTDRPYGPHQYRDTIERITETRSWIESVRRDRVIRFWYNDDEPLFDDYRTLNSTYLYSYSRWGAHFPQFACDPPLPPDTVLVVSTMREGAARRSRVARWGSAACLELSSGQDGVVSERRLHDNATRSGARSGKVAARASGIRRSRESGLGVDGLREFGAGLSAGALEGAGTRPGYAASRHTGGSGPQDAEDRTRERRGIWAAGGTRGGTVYVHAPLHSGIGAFRIWGARETT